MYVVGYGYDKCPLTQDFIKAFEKAKNKNKYKEAIGLCEDILRRIPNSVEYKKELADLKVKLKQ